MININTWLNDNELAINIWKSKYQYNNESFDEWLNRVSGHNEELKQKMLEKKFLFGGRILSNRGLEKHGKKVTMSNCYVVKNPEDNIEDIYRCCSDIARTFSMGGGCGIVLDKLRPRGANVNNSARTTTGAVSFMETFSKVSETIGQNGRRGALMIALDVNHPDIMEFIDIKTDLNKILGANISVKVDDEFMRNVLSDSTHVCEFYVKETNEVIRKEFKAREVFERLVSNNYDYAEPGILYWDTFNKFSLLNNFIKEGLFEYGGVNPCAEEPLPEGGACLLGSINLSEYVDNPFTDDASFNTYEFVKDIPIYIKALNDVLDENLDIHPLDYQCQVARDWRQIGLGVMGIADVFIKMGIRYGSDESIALLDRIGHVLAYTALHTSCEMNKVAEVPAKFCEEYPDYLAYSYFVQEHSNLDTDNYALFEEIRQYGLYNSALLTVAPTGTLSTMLGISGGIEPIFDKSYERRTISLHDEETIYKVYTPVILKLMDKLGITNEEDLPSYVVTAHDLDPYERVRLQATMQKHIDASISSTINLNEEATKEDVFNIYVEAWKEGCKGITIFRDNCKRTAILTTEPSKEEKVSEGEAVPSDIQAIPRGYILPTNDNVIGLKKKLSGGCGSLHLQVYFDVETGKMTEVFINKGGGGGCNSNLNALSRMISLALRGGIDIHDIADQLDSTINCPSFASARAKGIQLSKGSSCANSVGKALVDLNKDFQKMFALMQEEVDDEPIDEVVHHNVDAYAEYKDFIKKHGEIEFMKVFGLCYQCFASLEASGGCLICKNCGVSKCD